MSLLIRRFHHSDTDPVVDTLEAAYGQPGDRLAALRRSVALQPEGCLVAVAGGVPRGFVATIDYGPFAYVGMMAVHPAAQRLGIGLALMTRLLTDLDARGCPLAVLDATEAGALLYTKLGFVEVDQIHQLEPAVRATATARPPGAADGVEPLRPGALPEVIRLDAAIFGAPRPHVLASYLAELGDRTLVARDDAGRVGGYLVAQPRVIGPWLARDAGTAERLLAASRSLAFEAGPRIMTPGANRGLAPLAARHGFAIARSLRHMRRGQGPPPGRRDLVFGQASYALG